MERRFLRPGSGGLLDRVSPPPFEVGNVREITPGDRSTERAMIVEKKRERLEEGKARESLYRPGFLPAAGWLVFLPPWLEIRSSQRGWGEPRGCAVSVNYALTIGLRFNYIGQELGGSGGEKRGGVRLLGNGRVLELVSLSSDRYCESGGISMLTIDTPSILIR